MAAKIPADTTEALKMLELLQSKITILQKENESKQTEIAELKDKVQKQEIRISNLTEMLVNSRKKIFGKSSEQAKYIGCAEQITLFNEAEKESSAGAKEPDEKTHLENVLLDNCIDLTNNVAERAIKPFVMGRKNWLFSDTDKGADASARCYSIIESAKLNNLNVFAYLSHLLTELPKLGEKPDVEQVDKLLPWSDALPEFCKNLSAKEKSNDEQKEKC